MFRRNNIYIGFLIFIFFSFSLYAQSFKIKKYSFEDGLPDTKVTDLLQDTTGLMWFTTPSGITTYNGNKWNIVNPGIEDNKVYKLLEKDLYGNIWVLPENPAKFLIFYNYINWNKIPLPPVHEKTRFNSFSVNYSNDSLTVIIGTSEGILLYSNSRWLQYNIDNGLPGNYVFATSVYKGNSVIAATMRGPVLIKNGVLQNGYFEKFNIPGNTVFAMYNDPESEKTWLLGNNWLGYLENDSFHLLNENFEFPVFNQPNEYFITSDGQQRLYLGNQASAFWVNTENGKLHFLSDDHGTIREGATNAFVDREQNVWLSSNRGILKIRRSTFVNFYKSDGILENEVASIEALKDLLVLGHNNGITLINRQQIDSIIFNDPNPAVRTYNRVLDLLTDENKTYIAASYKGTGILGPDGHITWFPPNKNTQYSCFAKDSNGVIWVGSSRGLFRFENGEPVMDSDFSREYRIQPFIRKLDFLSDGTLAISNIIEGLILRKGNNYITVKGDNPQTNSVYGVYEYNDTLLVATGKGLYYRNGGKLLPFEGFEKPVDQPVYFIKKGSDNEIWLGLNNGIYNIKNRKLKYYGVDEGLSGPETNRSAGFLDNYGNFWIGTNDGLSLFSREYSESFKSLPGVKIDLIENSAGKVFNPYHNFSTEHSDNNIRIEYSGLSFIDEKENTYKVELYNFHKNLIDHVETKENSVRFSNLEPDIYYITVQMTNPKGVVSSVQQTAFITVESPFYNQVWFYIVIIVAGGFLLYIAFDIYSNKKYSKELEIKVAERTKELEQSEKKYRQLVETAIDGIISTDNEFMILTWNKAAENIYGYTLQEAIGQNYFDITGSDIKIEKFKETVNTFFREETWHGELLQQHKSGRKINILVAASVFKDHEGKILGMVGICRDITDMKQLEKTKTMAILETLEKERNRISRDLHDDLGQILSSAKLKLEVFEYKSRIRDSQFNEAIELIGHAGKELRNIVHDLHPAEIERYGLTAAIELLIFQTQKLSGINVFLTKKQYKGSLSKKDELMIYRIVQEAIHNAVKHSKADMISVSLDEINNYLSVIISDKGIGFDKENIKLNKEEIHGYGLLNMFQRAEMIGANLIINSEPEKGTEIIIKMKVD